MRLRFNLTLLFLLVFLQQSISGPILGLDEAISDSSSTTFSNRVNILLNMHPLLQPSTEKLNPIAIIRPNTNKTSVFLFSIVLLFAFSFVRILFPRYFFNLFHLFTGFNTSKRHLKDQLENDNRASLWFYSIFFLSAGFIVFEFNTNTSGLHFSYTWYINYLLCTSLVIGLMSFRIGMIRLTGWIFKRSDSVQLYLFNTKLANEFLGLLLFPLCILLLVSSGKAHHTLLLTASVVCLVLFTYNYIRNIPVLRNLFRISFVHFLLYLCAFEVIPVLILIKLIR